MIEPGVRDRTMCEGCETKLRQPGHLPAKQERAFDLYGR